MGKEEVHNSRVRKDFRNFATCQNAHEQPSISYGKLLISHKEMFLKLVKSSSRYVSDHR